MPTKMLPLNLFAFDDKDKHMLLPSYQAIAKIGQIYLVSDAIELEMILQFIKSKININFAYELSLQNVFTIDIGNRTFYICQVLLNKGPDYLQPPNNFNTNYEFHTIGLCKINMPIDDVVISIKSNADLLIEKLFSDNNTFGESESFYKKYEILTNDFTNLELVFTIEVLIEIAKYEISILVDDQIMMINFEDSMKANQSKTIVNIFSKMNCITSF
jgi:hypothetical protein